MQKVWSFLTDYSLLLILGAVTALIWANTNPHSYPRFVEHPLWFNDVQVGPDLKYWMKAYGEGAGNYASDGAPHVLTVHYRVNDILMALFFAIAAKKVWEAIILKNGSLRGEKAATSLFVASVAFEAGPVQDAGKMGALFRLGAAILSIIEGKLTCVEKQEL